MKERIIKITDSKVFNIIQIGTGATGSQLLPFLTQLLSNFDDNYIKIIDGDIVEDKNLKNQKFLKRDINFLKTEVLCSRYQGVYPNLKISYSPEYIKKKEDILSFISSVPNSIPIIIGTVDNNATRAIIHEVFYDEEVPTIIYIDSGNNSGSEDLGRNGQIITGFKENNTVILKPAGDFFPEILNDPDTIEKVLSCGYISGDFPQNIATNIFAAANIFTILTNIISFNSIKENITFFDADKTQSVSRFVD